MLQFAGAASVVGGSLGGATNFRDGVMFLNPVGYWRLGEAAGNFQDETANNLDLAEAAGSGITRASTALLTTDTAQKSILYDHNDVTNPKVSHANDSHFDISADFSFLMWVKPSTTGATRTMMARETSTSAANRSYLIQQSNTNSFFFQLAFSSTLHNVATTGLTVTSGTTYFLAGTRKQGTSKIYVDGSLNNTNTGLPTGAFNVQATTFRIGTSSGSDRFGGNMQDVAIFNVELTAQDIADLWALR